MSQPSTLASAWDTSCVGQQADVSLLELSHLGEHLAHCGALRGPLDQLLAGAVWLQTLVAEHVVPATAHTGLPVDCGLAPAAGRPCSVMASCCRCYIELYCSWQRCEPTGKEPFSCPRNANG